MKTIEIATAQKVTIQYELSSLTNRLFAAFIDWCIMGITLVVISFLVLSGTNQAIYQTVQILILLPIFVFYTLASEILLDGQTLGKRVMKLKIVKLNGDAPTNHDYVMRWFFRFIDIYLSLGSVAALLINASPKGQRLGGMLSGTVVIRTEATRAFSLEDILKISSRENYEPTYTEVSSLFNEQDMLFIKRSLERDRKYKNKAHKKVIEELAAHTSRLLQIKYPKDPYTFLRTLLNDYIVLTR